MEEYKIEIIVGETAPKKFEEVQKIFKTAYNSDDYEDVTVIRNGIETKIDDKNYTDYVYSVFELTQIKKKRILNIQDKNELNSLQKVETIKEKIKENVRMKNEISKKNKEIEKKKKELEDIIEEEQQSVFKEIDSIHQSLEQKSQIIANYFDSFQKFMDESNNFEKSINEAEEKYKYVMKEIQSSIDAKKKEICEEIIKKFNEISNNHFKELEKKEKERKKEFEEILKNLNYRMYSYSQDDLGCFCKGCNNKICGILYKCEECKIDICEECEDKKYKEHPHNFIKIRKKKEKKKIEDNDDDKKKNNSKQNGGKYIEENYVQNSVIDVKESQSMFYNNDLISNNKDNLNYQKYIDQNEIEPEKETEKKKKIQEYYDKNFYSYSFIGGKNKLFEFDQSKKNIKYEINFAIKNTGKNNWKANETFLKTNENSEFNIVDFKLKPLVKEDYQKVILPIPSLAEMNEGDYDLILDFCVSDKKYGEPLKIKIKILPDEKKKLIDDFRIEYDLSKKDYPDELIYKVLEECRFNKGKAFDRLFKE